MAQSSGEVLLDRGIERFGIAWILAFLASVTLVTPISAVAAHSRYALIDTVLAVELSMLALGWIGVVVAAMFARQATPVAKLVFVMAAGGLLLPLLWSPVLGAVVAAWLTGAAIEYSQVYAQFRIHVGQLLFPLVTTLTRSDLVDLGWNAFQSVATIIGFVAAFTQLWPGFVASFRGSE